jgi:hypothetical protein
MGIGDACIPLSTEEPHGVNPGGMNDLLRGIGTEVSKDIRSLVFQSSAIFVRVPGGVPEGLNRFHGSSFAVTWSTNSYVLYIRAGLRLSIGNSQ